MRRSTVSFFLTLWWQWAQVILNSDAEVVVDGKLLAAEHLWPREPVPQHQWFTSGLNDLAERSTRPDGVIEADWGKEGTEEDLGVWMASNV